MKLTTEQKRLIAAQWDGSPITVQGAPIEEVKAALDRLSKDLEKMSAAQQEIVHTIESTDFKELEERMLITTAAERALFTNASQLGRNKSNLAYFTDLINSTDFWANPRVQIDKDYAEYCADLDNRPNFLAWCVSRAYRGVTINKTTNLGATKLWTF